MANDAIDWRIARARETHAALEEIRASPNPENIAALHRLHAKHLREDGDHDRATKADARAKRAEEASSRSPDTAN